MGFLIEGIKTRDADGVINIRGCDDGTIEYVKWVTSVNSKTGEENANWSPYKFYASLEQALDKLFRMRVCNRDAKTLEELIRNVREEREALHEEFQSHLLNTRRKR